MKTYDEVFENVMKATDAHHKKMRRIQNAVSATAVCAVCIIGTGMFLKLEKPFSVPSETQSETMTMTTDEMTRMLDTTASAPASSDSAEPSNSISHVKGRNSEPEQENSDNAVHTSTASHDDKTISSGAVPSAEILHPESETTRISDESGTHTYEIETTTVTTAHTEKSTSSATTEKTTVRTTAATKETAYTTQKTESAVQTTVTTPETTAVTIPPATEQLTETIPPETESPTEELILPVTEITEITEIETETETEPETEIPVESVSEETEEATEPETSETTTTTTTAATQTETTVFTSYQPPEPVFTEEEEYLSPEEWEIRYGTTASGFAETTQTSCTVVPLKPDDNPQETENQKNFEIFNIF